MPADFALHVTDIFHFRDGRTVFAGASDHGPGYIPAGNVQLWVDGEVRGLFRIEGEMLSCPPSADRRLRAVSTTETHCLDRSSLDSHQWLLKPANTDGRSPQDLPRGRDTVHRHLIGLDSPPPEFAADPVTQGPMLPENWDGDAWVASGPKYWLRAWNSQTGRVAYGMGETYADARQRLLEDIHEGARRVEARVHG